MQNDQTYSGATKTTGLYVRKTIKFLQEKAKQANEPCFSAFKNGISELAHEWETWRHL